MNDSKAKYKQSISLMRKLIHVPEKKVNNDRGALHTGLLPNHTAINIETDCSMAHKSGESAAKSVAETVAHMRAFERS